MSRFWCPGGARIADLFGISDYIQPPTNFELTTMMMTMPMTMMGTMTLTSKVRVKIDTIDGTAEAEDDYVPVRILIIQ